MAQNKNSTSDVANKENTAPLLPNGHHLPVCDSSHANGQPNPTAAPLPLTEKAQKCVEKAWKKELRMMEKEGMIEAKGMEDREERAIAASPAIVLPECKPVIVFDHEMKPALTAGS